MKKLCFLLLTICLIGTACEKKEQSLIGTKWKLAGVINIETSTLKELELKNCEECYTLIFETDDTLITWSCANGHTANYIIDYNENRLNVINNLLGTMRNECGDGDLYLHLFKQIQSFCQQNNELYLYCSDEKNYLFFKRIEL